MIRALTLLCFLTLCYSSVFLNGQSPTLSGSVFVDVKTGLFRAKLQLTGFPEMVDPSFCLNRAMNIKYLRYNGKVMDYNVDWGIPGISLWLTEGRAYVLPLDTLLAKDTVSFEYTAAFPVYDQNDEGAESDGMSDIAIVSNLFRAAHQTLWYPVLYDRATGFILSKYQYRIELKAPGCKNLYLSGSAPIKGSQAVFSSELPNDLLLYLGKYNADKSGDVWFLNHQLTVNEREKMAGILDDIRQKYGNWTGMPYKQDIVLGHLTSKGPANQYENWAFVVYPCVLANLKQLPQFLDKYQNKITQPIQFKLYSHELAHHYFGLKVMSLNRWWGFYSETFAEYMALLIIRETYSLDEWKQLMFSRYFSERNMSKQFIPLYAVEKDIDNVHKYQYYPMVLFGLESIIGKEKMLDVLKYMVSHLHSNRLDFNDFKKAVLGTGVSEEVWVVFETQFAKKINCLEAVKKWVAEYN